ncbi:unnamed protein product [Rotaria socialis]|uniref:Reverse transcriptase domain-containing protein n=1 Tax=Rotaria socialis TaxID=392032 RepID=A0A817SI48_9BILA|nr:unnamed protein product [Rotaria socialis]CAF3320141.1 unnamed protein product [Rotaria socialis]CAF3331871.1 unnamed protein product [Rotaria socialis]CAF4467959.1 unnamed protein product [Rotaria socialis]CAF4474208.1 unnamed protein product [Rotaria socialis]
MYLQQLLEDVPKKGAILIIGDWNAKVGDTEVSEIVDKYGLGKCNETGEKLIEFYQVNLLIITNICFQQPKRRLYTWTSPSGQHRNQIDYILCNRRWKSSITSVKTRPDADCGTGHELILAKLKIKLKRPKKVSKAVKRDLQNTPHSYNVEVKSRFAGRELSNKEPEKLWQEIDKIIHEEVGRNIPAITTTKKRTWISKNTLKIAREKREAKINGNKQLFSKLNADFQRETQYLEDGEYELEPDIPESEVRWAMQALINGKAPGQDEIPIELFKVLKEGSIKVLTTLCRQIWKTKQWPSDWKKSIFIMIPKNRNVKDCSNYRTAALISHTCKIMLKVVQRRLQSFLERELPDTQAGFRKRRGTRDQIANLRWVIEKVREQQQNFYFCFIDHSKAFNCGSWETM